jgi:hypothetical protein
MQRNPRLAGIKTWLAALLLSVLVIGGAYAQGDLPAYMGKFTLPCQVHWGKSVLEPGDYTIRIISTGTPIIALVRKVNGEAVTRVISGVRNERAKGVNALLIREKHGKPTVHSLSLADLGIVVIYDPELAQKPVEEARDGRTVPVLSAKN